MREIPGGGKGDPGPEEGAELGDGPLPWTREDQCRVRERQAHETRPQADKDKRPVPPLVGCHALGPCAELNWGPEFGPQWDGC